MRPTYSPSTVFIPFYGRLALLYGRRWTTIIAVAIFIIGSGLSGGATSTAILITGRLIQGTGGAGISATTNIIISDLTSVRERGKYFGILFGVFGIGIAAGPPVGGLIVQHAHWHWIFWLNLPVGGLALAMLVIFLHVPSKTISTIRFDLTGNLILVASAISILLALSWADTRYPWASWQILVPLITGLVGMVVFHVWESQCTMPIVPSRLFVNRTSTISFVSTFMAAVLTSWRLYFIAVYLQGVLMAPPGVSGVLLLPSVLIFVPASAFSGVALARFGRYKPLHLAAYAAITVAAGLYIDLDEKWSTAKIVIYQLIAGVGSGMLINTTLPAAQAALSPADALPAAAFWAYIRAFGNVWGVAIPAAIFNSRFAYYAGGISYKGVRESLGGGNAYAHISSTYILSLPPEVQGEVVRAYLRSLKVVWGACLGFTVLALLLTVFEKEIPMRTTLDTVDTETDETQKDEESGVARELERFIVYTKYENGCGGDNGAK